MLQKRAHHLYTLVCLEVGEIPDHLSDEERVSELVKDGPSIQQNFHLPHQHQHTVTEISNLLHLT